MCTGTMGPQLLGVKMFVSVCARVRVRASVDCAVEKSALSENFEAQEDTAMEDIEASQEESEPAGALLRYLGL